MRRNCYNGILAGLVAIGAFGTSSAQTTVVLDTNPPPAAAPTTVVRSSGTASARYNKFSDTTSASSEPIRLKIGEAGWGTLTAGFTSKGKEVTKPSAILLSVFTAAPDRSFVDNPNATVFADGEKLFDSQAKIRDARTNGSEVYTAFEIAVSLTDFEKIVRADKFAVSIGTRGWIVPKEKFSNWGDLLGLFESR